MAGRRAVAVAASADPSATLDILGVPVSALPEPEVGRWLAAALATSRGGCRHVVTLNPEYVMTARRDPAFAAAVRAADLATADGVGITLAARIIHGRAVPRVTGVSLVERLAGSGAPLFLLGAGPGVAELAAANLGDRFPATRVVGWWDGGTPDAVHDAETRDRIARSGAEVVLVAYGAPGQVRWIARNREALAASGVRLAIGVGGTFDYLAGTATLPPGWVRQLGVEWLYRLAREPWRWRRQRVLPVFAALTVAEAARSRCRRLRRPPDR